MIRPDSQGRVPCGGWFGLPGLLLNIALTLLVGAVAINWGMQLIQEVWVPLVIVIAVLGLLAASGFVVWRRWRRW